MLTTLDIDGRERFAAGDGRLQHLGVVERLPGLGLGDWEGLLAGQLHGVPSMRASCSRLARLWASTCRLTSGNSALMPAALGENVVWQLFSDMEYYQSKLPCDATQIGSFRRVLGEAGLEQLLKTTIAAVMAIKAVKPVELDRVIVDSTVQEKAVAHPTYSRLLEVAEPSLPNTPSGLACRSRRHTSARCEESRGSFDIP